MRNRKFSLKNIRGFIRFEINIPELAPGEMHSELAKIQSFLSKLNYLPEGYGTDRLDNATQTALKMFQALHSLPQTGTTDAKTVKVIQQPKCGTPDPKERLRLEDGLFVLTDFAVNLKSGCALLGPNPIIYTISDKTTELPVGLSFNYVRDAIKEAFDTWERVIPIKFKHIQGDPNAHFKFKWAKDFHDDPQKFDDIGGLLAHAFYPGTCGASFNGQTLSGQCHFDRTEKWGFDEDPEQRLRDLETVALHEIGHLLGLTHSVNQASTMHDIHIEEVRRTLSDDVVDAIQLIYGKP